MKRESGYYWVKYRQEWIIASYGKLSNCWWICFSEEIYHNTDFEKIDETPITRN